MTSFFGGSTTSEDYARGLALSTVDTCTAFAKLTLVRTLICFLCSCALACGGNVRSDADADIDAGNEGGRVPRLSDGGLFVDPKCPDAGPPPIQNECDVLRPLETCSHGSACYPIAIPPDHPCETERYGSACLQPGTGRQGAPCGGTNGCAPGFVCVITGGSTECAKACALGSKGACDEGFVCEPIDVPGYAVCL